MVDSRNLALYWAAVSLLGIDLLMIGPRPARSDQIMLRGGGQIRGKVVDDSNQPDRVLVLTETGKTPLSFQKSQVVQVVAEASVLDDYLLKRDKASLTAGSQFELGRWCAEHKLIDLAKLHYEIALKHDKSYAPAHQKLGHVLHADRWLNGDELREEQGLVRYKGKWITQEEKERREQQAASTAEQASWAKQISILRQAILFGTDDRRHEAESQLMAIREPIAVAPLVRVLGEDVDGLRIMLDHVLGVIPGPEAATALVNRLLVESDADVRHVSMEELEHCKEPVVLPQLVAALRSTNPEIVNRAAWALANLNAVKTVPRLVTALITTQYRVMMVPSGPPTGGNYGVSFGSVASAPGLSSPVMANGSSIGSITPPAVAPGAIAFGATSSPYSAIGSGISTGPPGARGPVPRLVPFTFRNVEVLMALIKLTGHDFGYDIPTWRDWVRTSFEPDPTPARRVPQP